MKLPVWQTYIEAFDYCWRERRAAVRFGAVPFVAILVLASLLKAFGFDQSDSTQSRMSAGDAGLAALVGVFEAVVYLPMAVSWYRMVVFGEAQAARRPAFTMGRLEGRLLLWQIIIVIIAGLALALVGVLAGAVYIAAGLGGNKLLAGAAAAVVGTPLVLVILAIVNRLGMALVLVAAEEPVSLKLAWELTRGYSTRLFILVVLITLTGAAVMQGFKLIALPVGMIAAMIFNSTAKAIVPYLTLVGQDLAGLVVFLAIATLFGMAYRKSEEHWMSSSAKAEDPGL